MERVPTAPSDRPARVKDVRDPNRVQPDGASDRAQPGDVLGIERDGETTELGDTREDEDRRREDAEEGVRKDRA